MLDCILLTEMWHDETGNIELIEACPPKFSFLHCPRVEKKGGGVAAIFSDNLSCKNILSGNYSTFEYLAIVMKSASPFLVLTVYHPPKLKKGFIDEFTELLSKISVKYDTVLISGDFNIHIDNSTDFFANQFTDMLSTFDLIQHIAVPTHNKGHTLDLVISKGLDITTNCIRDVGISDHFCIFFNLSCTTKPVPRLETVKRRPIRTETLTSLLHVILKDHSLILITVLIPTHLQCHCVTT